MSGRRKGKRRGRTPGGESSQARGAVKRRRESKKVAPNDESGSQGDRENGGNIVAEAGVTEVTDEITPVTATPSGASGSRSTTIGNSGGNSRNVVSARDINGPVIIHNHQDKREKTEEKEAAAKVRACSEEDRNDVTVTISGQRSKSMPPLEMLPVLLKDGHIDIAGHYDDNNITTKAACQKGVIVQLEATIKSASEKKCICHTLWTLDGKGIDDIATTLSVSHEAIFELKERLQRLYDAMLRRVGQSCLVLEFEHFTRENAEKMVDEKDNVMKDIKAVLGEFSMKIEDVSCTVEIKDVEKIAPLPSHDIKRGVKYTASEGKSSGHGTMSSDSTRQEVGDDRTDKTQLEELQNDSEVTGCLICSSLVKERDEDTDVNILACHLHASYCMPSHASLFVSGDNRLTQKSLHIKKLDEMGHKVSALRNSGGGTLYMHVPGLKQEYSCLQYIDELIDSRLSGMLEPGEFFDDVYKRTIQEDESIIKLTVSYSSNLILTDTCTYSPTFYGSRMTSHPQLRSYLFGSRAIANSDPQCRGLPSVLSEGIDVKFKSVFMITSSFGELDMVSYFKDTRLIQNIAALSKNINGGSVYYGIRQYKACGYKVDGIPLAMIRNQTILENCLQELIADNVVIVENINQRKPYELKNLVAIGFHKVNDEKCVIEVAVRPVYGCVFTNKNGPIACKLNVKCELVRMSMEEVMQRLKDKA